MINTPTRKAARALLDNRANALTRQVNGDKRVFGHILYSTETAVAVLAADYEAHGRSAGRVVKAICAIGLTVAAGCFLAATFAPLPARADAIPTPAPRPMMIVAWDSVGGEWIAGRGDSCDSAYENAQFPADLVGFECVPESGE